MATRRLVLGLCTLIALAACTTPTSTEAPPIVFVHGNGDSAALWQTTVWRFESNGWPRDRLHAIDLPYPLARDDDTRAQAGRSGTADYAALVKSEVERVLRQTGARQVVLVGNSRGGYAIRNYVQNGGGDRTVSHVVLGGTPNHGVWAIPGFREGNEFSGTGPFLKALNAPKNAAGDEVTGPVKWLTIRSDNNDKFAQPDGLWIGQKGTATFVTSAGPELKGARNVVLPRIDHRETSFSPAAFEETWRFLTGTAPPSTEIKAEPRVVLSGNVTGLGVSSADPQSGNFVNNRPLAGALLEVFATDPATGQRRGGPAHRQSIDADGRWGPFTAQPGVPYEFVLSAPGYATAHIYRSGFPRSSSLVHLRGERIAEADKEAPSVVTLTRPRGYFDPARDRMSLDGQSPPPGALPGAGVSSSKVKPAGPARPVVAEFNGEKLTGRTWPEPGHVTVLELTY